MKKTFGVVGGDRRFAHLCRLLEQDGHTVHPWRIGGQGVEAALSHGEAELRRALSADVVVLPLPLCNPAGTVNCAGAPLTVDALLDLLEETKPDGGSVLPDYSPPEDSPSPDGSAQPEKSGCRKPRPRLVLAGMAPEPFIREAERRGVPIVDYFRREALTVANAAATADAALALTVEHTGQTVLGKRCLVLGFGRIGKLLCHRLRGAGADVAATARTSADLAWIRAYGYRSLETGSLSGKLDGFQIVYNTVPAPVLGRTELAELPGNVLLVELASQPGICPKAAEALGLELLRAGGLPGRLVPVTAAEVLRRTVYEIIKEGELA